MKQIKINSTVNLAGSVLPRNSISKKLRLYYFTLKKKHNKTAQKFKKNWAQ